MLSESLASLHSATPFLNALFLEWRAPEITKTEITVDLPLEGKITIPLKVHSRLGRHLYTGEFFFESSTGQESELSFNGLVERITRHLGTFMNITEDEIHNFLSRIQNSHRNIETTLRERAGAIETLSQDSVDFITAEQSLFLGHTFHPTPKSKSEFTDEDHLTYSPEMGGSFPLQWILVKKEIFFQKCSVTSDSSNWLEVSFGEDSARAGTPGFVPFAVHPWQKQHICSRPDIQEYMSSGQIIELGAGENHWYPTSSLRTLYREEASYQIKFSMNVKLTNSVRQLCVKELNRGLQVHEVFSHELGKKFSEENPQFELIQEPVFAGVLDKAGLPIPETLIMGRLNPFRAKVQAIVLATLTQDHPFQETNLIGSFITRLSESDGSTLKSSSLRWFNTYLTIALKPLLSAQADYGILLGSHQQNMILELKDNLPIRSYFRDCNGTGYSRLGFELFSQEVRSLDRVNGNILENDEANYLFGYYVIINSAFNTVSSIAHCGWITEDELISELKLFLRDLRHQGPRDPSFLNYLLESETLMHKGNFFCSLRSINENTEANPLSIYTEISNPLFERILS